MLLAPRVSRQCSTSGGRGAPPPCPVGRRVPPRGGSPPAPAPEAPPGLRPPGRVGEAPLQERLAARRGVVRDARRRRPVLVPRLCLGLVCDVSRPCADRRRLPLHQADSLGFRPKCKAFTPCRAL